MLRSHKVILVSHCILNQNAVVHPLARAQGAFRPLIDLLMDFGFGIVQLSCPETLMCGLKRLPMSKSDYDTPDYKLLCSELAARDTEMVARLKAGNVVIAGIIGIDQSPTCSQLSDTGHFMMALGQTDLIADLPKIDVPESYELGTPEADAFHVTFKAWLNRL